MVAGIGCRAGATASAVAEAIAGALERCGLNRSQIDALATAAAKSHESGIVGAAATLAVPLIFVAAAEMSRVADSALTSSPRVVALQGVPSVAETAALAAAGRSARLLGPRTATPTVTCAIAVGEGP
ncbi:MAG TPA: cobalamin biosynthesis protein [Hyphomicrobium sp.]